MLSERGLQIVEKLIDNNRMPITSKKLAMYLGVSERSVKTYIKEVSGFCREHGMSLVRKPGIGFVAEFTDEQIELINSLKRDQKIVMSKKQRMSYIMYILLSGWDTYTLSLFSDELNVSKKIIGDDINAISKTLEKYNIKINKVTGHGVFITGDEFSIRKAMSKVSVFPIGNKEVKNVSDVRMTIVEEELCINNFGKDNFEKAIEVIKAVEQEHNFAYTDYSFRMLAQYLCIQLFRIRMGNVIDKPIKKDNRPIVNEGIVNTVVNAFMELKKVSINEFERQYIDVLFESAAIQSVEGEETENIGEENRRICLEMLDYLSEILNVDLKENDLLKFSLESFIPASFIRTEYGIEVENPFLKDIKEMYSAIFATSFTLSKFYEQYCNATPTDHEISFLALFIGGAIHRNIKNVKAVLIGTSGMAAANIVARKIENRMDNVKIIAILSSKQINELDNFEFDIILSMMPNLECGNKVVHISPIISDTDERNIKDACFEVLSHMENKRGGFARLINSKYIYFVKEKKEKEEILKNACRILCEDGYVKEEFFSDVMSRENTEPTAIGNGVAIPHGTDKNVCRPIVFVIRLTYPVIWGNEMVDTIFLLALHFNNINDTKAFFSDFARILGAEEKIGRIRKTENIEQMEKTLREELHWD